MVLKLQHMWQTFFNITNKTWLAMLIWHDIWLAKNNLYILTENFRCSCKFKIWNFLVHFCRALILSLFSETYTPTR